MTDSARSYDIYGLHVRSSVALPFNRLRVCDSFCASPPSSQQGPRLAPVAPVVVVQSAADVTIRLGTVPRELPNAPGRSIGQAFWEARHGAFLMRYEGVARYLVTHGRDVLVEPWGGSDDDIGCIFAGTPLTALLQQRGMATFHAAAVQTTDGAALLLGESGDGKSTLAAALVERGYALVADDVTAVVVNRAVAAAVPGFNSLRLWKATLDKMRVAHRARSRVRGTLEKYWVPAPHFCSESLPVSAAFVLTPQNRQDIRIESMPPREAFRMLTRHTHRRRVMDALGQRPAHFHAATATVRAAPVMRVARPDSPFLLEELADRVEAHMTPQLPANGRKIGAKPRSAPALAARPPAAASSRRRSAPRTSAPAIVWLASWPKSGNTWLRAVLTNYLAGDGQPASINALVGGRGRGRDDFDECLGVNSADMTDDEVSRHLPTFRTALAESVLAARSRSNTELQSPLFVKTHEVYRLPDGAPRFPGGLTGAVYLVRNPLDVAVSYAHHLGWPIDHTIIKGMNDPDACEAHKAHGIYPVIPEPLTTWSNHVASWTEQTALPVHVARYEDLLADPHGQFAAIVRFAGLEMDGARLDRAVEHSAFHHLRRQEAADGFAEKQPTAPSFFRAGVAGQWRSVLEAAQVQALVDAHGDVMERFGYLAEALEGIPPTAP